MANLFSDLDIHPQNQPELKFLKDNFVELRKILERSLYGCQNPFSCLDMPFVELYTDWVRRPPPNWETQSTEQKWKYTLVCLYYKGLKLIKKCDCFHKDPREFKEFDENTSPYYSENKYVNIYDQLDLEQYIEMIEKILDEDEFKIWAMIQIEGKTSTEISMYLNIPAATIRKRWQRMQPQIRELNNLFH